jgi:hypothetical protein
MKAREVLLALLIVGAGVFTYYAKSGRIGPFLENWDGGWRGGEEFVFEEKLEVPAPLPAEVRVVNAHGAIEVQGGDVQAMTVVLKKSVYERVRAKAEAVAAELKAVQRREGSTLVLATNRESFRRKNFEIHFVLTVPAGAAVRLENSYGPVRVFRTGRTEIENPHGEVRAEDVGGPLQISHRYGEIVLKSVAGKTVVLGSHSQVTGSGLAGAAEIETSHEPVSLTGVGPVQVRAQHGAIEVRQAAGPVGIIAEYAEIILEDVRGDLTVEAPNSGVRAEGVEGGTIRIRATRNDIELTRFSGRTVIDLKHGDLRLGPTSLEAPIDIEAEYANVTLAWPAGLRAPFSGRARTGQIFWNLVDRPDVEESNGRAVTKAYQGEGGKPGVNVSTTYGDIRIDPAPAVRRND